MPDRVLLTGISGYVGGHTALALLDAGYIVRGSVRSLDKAEKVRAGLAKAGAAIERLEFVRLDLTEDEGWTEAMAGCRYLLHTASPFVTRMPKDRMELVGPAIAGTRRAVEAALAADIERVVLTSSMAAMVYGHDAKRTAPFTEADWTRLDGRDINAYVESKTRAEREAWDVMEKAGRSADLAVINPSAIVGPLLDDDPGTSVALMIRLMNGSVPAAPRMGFVLVDVRDVAAAHLAAMIAPSAGGHRFPLGDKSMALIDIANTLRAHFPERAGKLPRLVLPDWLVHLYGLFDSDLRGNLGELGIVKQLDSSAIIALLGRPPIPAETSLIDTVDSLIAEHLI